MSQNTLQQTQEIDTLHKYGKNFQIKSLSALISDKVFLEQIIDIVDPEYYDSEATKWIVSTIEDYYDEYKKTTTLDVFKHKLVEERDDALKESIKQQLRTVYTHVNDEDLEYVKEQFLDFCKNQKLKKAILQSAELLSIGEYEQIRTIIDDALSAGQKRDLGHDYKNELEERMKSVERNVVPTPWDAINNITGGGLGSGELGIVVAPSGAGKSWLLQILGSWAIRNNKNVVHYTLELNEHYTGKRYDTIISKVSVEHLRNQKEKVAKSLEQVNGNVRIEHYPPKSIGIDGLRAHLNLCKNFDFKPDMVIVDYGDLLKSNTSHDSLYREGGDIYTLLRGLAGEFEVPIWTASQTQRSAIREDIIEADRIADSYAKIMIGDFILSLSRKRKDKMKDKGRVHVIKNRFGPDGQTFPASINTEIGDFKIHEDQLDVEKERAQKRNNLLDEVMNGGD